MDIIVLHLHCNNCIKMSKLVYIDFLVTAMVFVNIQQVTDK